MSNSPVTDAASDAFPVSSLSLNLSPAGHEFDPFDTLPTSNLPRQCSENLLQYCERDICLPV